MGMDQARLAQVVQAILKEDLGTSLEPDSLAEWHAAPLGQRLRKEVPQHTQHGPLGIDHIHHTVAGQLVEKIY